METTVQGEAPKLEKKTLFASAKTVEKKTEKKDEKQSIILTEAQYPGISDKLKNLTDIRERLADMEANGKMLEGIIKDIGKEKFAELYGVQKSNPGSFILKGEAGGAMMCILMDKYLTIDGGRADQLKQNFGADCVTCTTEYSFNPSLLEKYEEVLSELIMGSNKINEEDKSELIIAKQKWSIAKGMIDRVIQVAGTDVKMVGAVLNAIQPICQLKNTRG
jgi:hypothetical protein